MAATNASLPEEISDLVRDWELKADVADTHTIHTNLIFDASTGRQIPQNERWEHVKELGSGSFGVVNLEKCVSGQRAGASRAVKRIQLRPRPVEADFKVIYRELSTIIKFSHQKYRDYFVQSFGWFYTQSTMFITLEYLPSGDLERYIYQRSLPETEARRICHQVLQGLHFMHSNKFAHRDLKPGNILVQHIGPSWWVKLSDFGTSKRIGATALRTITGTEEYLAPELQNIFNISDLDLMKSKTHSFAVDIWSTGVLAFRIVTGQLPFESPMSLYCYVIQQDALPFPTEPYLTTECTGFITSMMTGSPRNRPSAVEALENPWIDAMPSTEKIDAAPASEVPGVESSHSTVYSDQWNLTDVSTISQHSADMLYGGADTDLVVSSESTITPISADRGTRIDLCLDNVQRITRDSSHSADYRQVGIIALSHDSKWLAAATTHNFLDGWELGVWPLAEQGDINDVRQYPTVGLPYKLCFTPDSRQILGLMYRAPSPEYRGGFAWHIYEPVITWELNDQGINQHLVHKYLTTQIDSFHPAFTDDGSSFPTPTSSLSADGQLLAIAGKARETRVVVVKVWRLSVDDGRFHFIHQMPYPETTAIPRLRINQGACLDINVPTGGFDFLLRVWKHYDDGRLDQVSGLSLSITANIEFGKQYPEITVSPDNRWALVWDTLSIPRGLALVKLIDLTLDKMSCRDIGCQLGVLLGTSADFHVTCAAFSPDSLRIAISLSVGKLLICRLDTWHGLMKEHEIDCHEADWRNPIYSQLIWSSDGGFLVVGDSPAIKIWRVLR